ncbi:MAG: bifunctional UDP-N-acetylmuramoyl-tripeptide:D-alanyl-D-alanine ligase/alanine racemase [Tunicatimonas sp.]
MRFSDLPDILGGTLLGMHDLKRPVRYLLTDSRRGDGGAETLFFAIDGLHHDGHRFIPELYVRGVRQFVVEKPVAHPLPEANVLQVDHGITALQELVAAHRQQFIIPVIGLTGSNGKTIVKEWLYQLLSPHQAVAISPKSYNSQIGVPLSVWGLNERHQLGIFEAGISRPGEMARVARVIRPTVGIFTNIGPAHDEGFASRTQKIQEKALLFAEAEKIIYRYEAEPIQTILQEMYPDRQHLTWSLNDAPAAAYRVRAEPQGKNTQLTVHVASADLNYLFVLPFQDEASLENALHGMVFMLDAGYEAATIQDGLRHLQRVAMRLELKQGINYCHLVDDSYSHDMASFGMALDFLNQQLQHDRKTVIVSDMLQTGQPEDELYHEVRELLENHHVNRLIGIGPRMREATTIFADASFTYEAYPATEQFLREVDLASFSHESILVKGARAFAFEKIVQRLQQKIHGTVLEINLDAVMDNLNYYRSHLQPGVRVLGVVKAFSYGGSAFEVANLLQYHQIDYLMVAYVDEGITLRERGIRLPIIVLNPSPDSFGKMADYRLEPELYSFRLLRSFIDEMPYLPHVPPVHLKLDTGMHRLGFVESEWDQLETVLRAHPTLRVASIFSHLVASDHTEHDDFTHQQVASFDRGCRRLIEVLGYTPIRHVANTVGMLRFPDYQYDMVRLGGGLYGVDTWGADPHALRPVARLRTVVSQVKQLRAGDTVGYSRQGVIDRPTQTATIAIGYADGFDRRFGNGRARVKIRGHWAPTVGRVCMDMIMVDVTGLGVEEGDEVIIFEDQETLWQLAKPLESIPYELLTKVGERVKRVYYRE